MKTYLFDSINKNKGIDVSMDVQTILCGKSWWVFGDSEEKEVYIFQENGTLIVSVNGKVSNAKWQYVPANKSLIISEEKEPIMVHPAYIDDTVMILQIDGTKLCAFLINESNRHGFTPKSYNCVVDFILLEEQKMIEHKQKIEEIRRKRSGSQSIKHEKETQRKDALKRDLYDLASEKIAIPRMIYLLSLWVVEIFVLCLMYVSTSFYGLGNNLFFFFLLCFLGGLLFISVTTERVVRIFFWSCYNTLAKEWNDEHPTVSVSYCYMNKHSSLKRLAAGFLMIIGYSHLCVGVRLLNKEKHT